MFVLADPEVFSGPVGQVLSDEIETSSSGELLEPADHMRCAVQRGLQAVLGAEQCHGKKLAQALRVSQPVLYVLSPPGVGGWGGRGRLPDSEISECWGLFFHPVMLPNPLKLSDFTG